ncbi:putative alpha-galactosidase B protein [Rutstroemia sp. NJR-2017a BVV2]|nr:putative alpha-galactosidase B protein [Rutstroemia sp. NJR-2017a BVV2]
MRDALLAQNRTILYSLCDQGSANVTSWANATGSSWRTKNDIRCKNSPQLSPLFISFSQLTPHKANWNYITFILNINSFLMNAVDFWGHNDLDMLEVGVPGLSTAEERSHFAFWAAAKSPLIIGADLSAVKQSAIDIMLNKYLLTFNQDPVYGAPAKPYKWGVNLDWTWNMTYPAEYWSGASSNGTLVLMLNSLSASGRKMTADFSEIPGLSPCQNYTVIDIWNGKNLGTFKGFYNATVASHDTAALLIQRQNEITAIC